MIRPKLLLNLLLIATSLLCSFTVAAYDFEAGGIYYNITSTTDKTVAVTLKDDNGNSYSGAVTIPASVENSGTTYTVTSIGEQAFIKCAGLKEVYNCSSKPQAIDSGMFDEVDKAVCTLYVPTGCTGAYKSAEGWKDFTNIKKSVPAGVGGKTRKVSF